MLDLDTTLSQWIGFFLAFAMGTGLSINQPYTAVQTVLEQEDIATGNGTR